MTLPSPRSPSPSPSPSRTCAGCGSSAVAAGWTREATARELLDLVRDPGCPSVTEADLGPGASPSTVPVLACAACALPPEQAARVHSPTCSAPPLDPSCRACATG